MKQRPTPPRSTDISGLHPNRFHRAFFLLIFTFIVPVAQCKTDRTNDLNLNLDHHRVIVEELKTKVLQTMGRTAPPSGFNSSHRSLNGKLIREFFRSKLNNTTHIDSLQEEDIYVNNPQTHVFHSSDPEFMVPVQPMKTPLATPVLTIVKFSTNIQQPDVPYHDLLIKSAILRLRIIRQKRKLLRKVKLPLNVTFYLMDNSDQTGVHREHLGYTPLRSVTVNKLKSKTIEINIESHLLSHLVDADNKTVTVGVKIDQTFPVAKNGRNTKPNSKRRKHKTTTTTSRPNKEIVRLSKVILQMTSQTKDLRRARTKRQDADSDKCSGNLCCRHSIYVNFTDIGWNDWVIYPEGYTAYYCKGDCPNRYRYASSFSHIKSILHERAPDIMPGLVCAPSAYKPLEMIVYDGTLKELPYPNMVVDGCRCH